MLLEPREYQEMLEQLDLQDHLDPLAKRAHKAGLDPQGTVVHQESTGPRDPLECQVQAAEMD